MAVELAQKTIEAGDEDDPQISWKHLGNNGENYLLSFPVIPIFGWPVFLIVALGFKLWERLKNNGENDL